VRPRGEGASLTEAPGEGPLRGPRGASNSLAPALPVCPTCSLTNLSFTLSGTHLSSYLPAQLRFPPFDDDDDDDYHSRSVS